MSPMHRVRMLCLLLDNVYPGKKHSLITGFHKDEMTLNIRSTPIDKTEDGVFASCVIETFDDEAVDTLEASVAGVLKMRADKLQKEHDDLVKRTEQAASKLVDMKSMIDALAHKQLVHKMRL